MPLRGTEQPPLSNLSATVTKELSPKGINVPNFTPLFVTVGAFEKLQIEITITKKVRNIKCT